MRCTHCGQWNSRQSRRCAFCHNQIGATEDLTAQHPSQLYAQRQVSIPRPHRGPPQLGPDYQPPSRVAMGVLITLGVITLISLLKVCAF